MRRLDSAPEVISIALALKLDPRLGVVEQIISYCRHRVESLITSSDQVRTLADLQGLVARSLNLVFEEVASDEQLTAVVKRYVDRGEIGFASIPMQLEGDTFATLMERQHAVADDEDRYIAFIDCRGEKARRRYFTRWHEIAHLLTHVTQLALPFSHVQRSEASKADPVERLMDSIAAEIGFYSPLFVPPLRDEVAQSEFLTFDGVERVRDRACPEASFQATLNACVQRNDRPTILFDADMGYKKAEAAEVRRGQLAIFPGVTPAPRLRVANVIQNPEARATRFAIHKNMAVPAESLVARHFAETAGQASSASAEGEEDLSVWRRSSGETIGEGTVRIEARRIGGVLTALVQRV